LGANLISDNGYAKLTLSGGLTHGFQALFLITVIGILGHCTLNTPFL
jgi:hypothetical protein